MKQTEPLAIEIQQDKVAGIGPPKEKAWSPFQGQKVEVVQTWNLTGLELQPESSESSGISSWKDYFAISFVEFVFLTAAVYADTNSSEDPRCLNKLDK